MRRALATLFAFGLPATALADPPDLRLEREPPPRHLRMRPRTAATAKVEPNANTPEADPKVPALDPTTTEALTQVGTVRDLRRPVSLRFNLGYVVDGASPGSDRTISDHIVEPRDFQRLRAYALGEGYFSSRGVVFPSLSTYFAARFQIARPTLAVDPRDPMQTPRVFGAPVATWFDRTGFEPRAGWGEVKDFLPDKRLAPLRIRAGELYVYGPWVLHMYGLNAAWDGRLVSGSLYGGSRVPDYTNSSFVDQKDRAGIGGFSGRVDLRALKSPIPFAVSVEGLAFTAIGADDNQATNHSQLQADWRPRKDFALIGRVRTLNGFLANEHLQLRSRYKQVSNLVFEVAHRHRKDWRWDPSVPNDEPNNEPLQAQRYLDLGPVVPTVLLSGRAGTLLKENLDLLVRGAYALDLSKEGEAESTYSASYIEAGAALEGRLRRTIALGLSGLTRRTTRADLTELQIPDFSGVIDPLPAQYGTELGERSFTEVGTTLRMSLGARRLSALVEIYGRRTRYARVYCNTRQFAIEDPLCMDDVATGLKTQDYRGGGRVTIDAWIGSQLRLFASYEVSSQLDFAREITGFKSLRLMMEGVY